MYFWTIPLVLLIAAVSESIVWEFRGQLLNAVNSALLAVAFAILLHKWGPPRE